VGLGEDLEGGEDECGAGGVLGEGLAGAGVDADGAVEISSCWAF
jgi:hypothetical protein